MSDAGVQHIYLLPLFFYHSQFYFALKMIPEIYSSNRFTIKAFWGTVKGFYYRERLQGF